MSDSDQNKVLFEALKAAGLPEERQSIIEQELNYQGTHEFHEENEVLAPLIAEIYQSRDFAALQNMEGVSSHYHNLKSLDDLLERDEQREKDGFKRKVHVGRVVKPGKGGKNKIIIVPTTTEEKFYHDSRDPNEKDEDQQDGQQTGETTGTAEGDEGDVIGERPLNPEQEGEGEGQGAGQGEGAEHDIGASAYDLGKILTEKFQLPNLKDKGKRKSIPKYVYDMTDRNRGEGQILDKKRTITEIIKTNIDLERFDPEKPMQPENLLLNPRDYIYRIMSQERDYESKAIVFFVRDYSGSMHGRPTEIVCTQHVMIYSWLMYQYKEQVETRFICHDTEAKEMKDFYSYHNSNVAGGTQIFSAFSLVNKIVEEENLARDYNVYVFYGGDGDDWNADAKKFVAEFDKMFSYVNRLGITIVQGAYAAQRDGTVFEKFLKKQELLEKRPDLLHLDVVNEDADDKRIIEGIKTLVSA